MRVSANGKRRDAWSAFKRVFDTGMIGFDKFLKIKAQAEMEYLVKRSNHISANIIARAKNAVASVFGGAAMAPSYA